MKKIFTILNLEFIYNSFFNSWVFKLFAVIIVYLSSIVIIIAIFHFTSRPKVKKALDITAKEVEIAARSSVVHKNLTEWSSREENTDDTKDKNDQINKETKENEVKQETNENK
jgi:hypothetical protein